MSDSYGFVKSKTTKYDVYTYLNILIGESSKYRFTLERGEIPIKFIGCPFIIKDHINYECVNGPEKKPKDNYLTNDHPTDTKKKFHLHSTKKYNCTAVLTRIQLMYFPEYVITECSLTKWRLKKQILNSLKKDIEMGKQIVTKNKYLVHVSLPSVHNHVIETSLLNLPINKSVYNEISRLPYSEEDGIIKQLLFCQQTEWQRYLLNRYGNVCFLDATYKTTKYALPLFLLVVKTNVNYSVVASFFVQYEDSKSVEDGLTIIKSWNTMWSPQYFVTDYCEAEYSAITRIFNCPTYICDFHREQAWLRWTNKQGNLNIKKNRGELLILWRNIANSRNNSEFIHKVEMMKLTDAWLKNLKAQDYFIKTRLTVEEKWTSKFFKLEFDIKIGTNNGVESQNKVLKHFYLKFSSDKSLNSTIENIIEQFLPQSLCKYQKKNFKLNNYYKKISNVIPIFLHGRPVTFVKHIYDRFVIAQNTYSEKRINKLTLLEHQFEVQSENGYNILKIIIGHANIYVQYSYTYVPSYSFNDLPEKFKNNVFISTDPRYSITSLREEISTIDLNMQNTTTATVTDTIDRLILKEQKSISAENIENNSNLPIQSREILKKITDLTYLIDQKEYSAEWSKQ
ncbi:zinc finger BED domain-containing protein 1-like [Aphis craccivora]|uniref:Zinc finger BED domain-containing protein 1-like n=1 Tax=Aphis craccivora TaxID=307492 RepID=A0A6G0XJL6_APHCR|nr:zinc finger BED domain-containing protein 1-like [Aphis craccivora]